MRKIKSRKKWYTWVSPKGYTYNLYRNKNPYLYKIKK